MMKDEEKTKEQLVNELIEMRRHSAELERAKAEHKRAEERLSKELGLRNFLIELYKKAPSLADKELYDYVLEQVVRLSDSTIGFFHLVSDDQKNVILTTWNSEALKNCTASYATHYPLDQAGNWVDCVRFRRPIVYNNYPDSPNQKGLPEGHTPVRRFMSVPVVEGEEVRIIFGVGNKFEEYNEDDAFLIQVVANDLQRIIGRRRAEEALQESEERFRTLADVTWEGIVIHREGIILDANESALKMIGYPAEESIGQSVLLFLAPESIEPALEKLKEGTDAPQLYLEAKAIRKDKTVFPIEMLGRPIKYKGLDARVLAIRDLTERKRAAEALQAAEYLYRILADRSQIASYIVQDKKIVFSNPHLSHYSGYGKEDLIGEEISKFVYPDDREMVRQKAIQMLKSESSIPYEYRIIDKRGQIRWVVETVASITYHGRAAALGSTMDITEHKRVEKQLQDIKDQLVQSEKLSAIGLLASGAAHEIRNPLNIISLNLQMLEIKGKLDEETKKAAEVCSAQIDRIVKIVDGMRTFSRISEKKLSSESIKDVIGRVLSLSAPRIKVENVSTDVRCDPDLPNIFVDKAAMEQVFINLISNALDAMKDGEKRNLSISAERKNENILVTVSDTGHGIQAEDFSKLFDPFFTTKGPDKGTGLGLSVSYGIIQDHKGKIWAENNEKGGASFYIELPIEKRA